MSSSKSIKVNYLYNLLYQILTFILPIITTPYLSRILGADGIGKYSYSSSIAYYFVMFGILGLDNYGNREIAMVKYDKEKLSKTFWNIYAMQLVSSLISVCAYFIFVIGNNSVNTIFYIQLIYVCSSFFNINWFFFGLEKFKLTVLRNTIIKILTVFSIFIFVKNSNDIYAYAIIMSLGLLITNIAIFPFLFKEVSVVKPSFKEIKKHVKPNLILFIPILSTCLYKVTDKVMIGILSTNNEVGFYENVEKVTQIPTALVSSLCTVMLPRISSMVSRDNLDLENEYLNKSLLFSTFITVSFSFGIMGISKEFIPLFFGNGFEKCKLLLQVLMPSCVFAAFSNVIRSQYLIPHKQDNIYIFSLIIGCIINIVLNVFFIRNYQSYGAAFSTLITEILVFIIQMFCLRKVLKNKIDFDVIFLLFIGGILMFLIIYNITLKNISIVYALLLKVIIGMFLYLILVFIVYFIKKRKLNKR